MVLTLIGPLNNIFGPGLIIDVADSGSGQPSPNERYEAFFFQGGSAIFSEVVGYGEAFVDINHQSSMIIKPVPRFPSFRRGASAGNDVSVQLQRVDNSGANLEPPHVIPIVTWDPSLQLQVLISQISATGGGLTPDQDQMLREIHNAVFGQLHNNP